MNIMNEYLDYDELVFLFLEKKINAVVFVTRQSEEETARYNDFCSDEGIDSKLESSAHSYLNYKESLLNQSEDE